MFITNLCVFSLLLPGFFQQKTRGDRNEPKTDCALNDRPTSSQTFAEDVTPESVIDLLAEMQTLNSLKKIRFVGAGLHFVTVLFFYIGCDM